MRVDTAAVAFLSTYEALAITTGLVPTVSHWAGRLPVPARAAVTAVMCGWLVDHWFGEDLAEWAGSTGRVLP